MQCDVCGGVTYISNKSKYLKTEMRYAGAVKTNLYNFKISFQIKGFSLKQLFHFTFHFTLQHKVLPSGASTGHIAMGNDNHLSTSRLSKQNTTKILEISHSKIMKNRPMLPLWRQTTAMASRFYFRVLQARTSRPLREEDSREHLGCLRIIFTGGGTTMMEQNII